MAFPNLPIGFHFSPTDVELINHYLKRKIHQLHMEYNIMPEVDPYKFEPWQLADISFRADQDQDLYFFAPLNPKYATGPRMSRTTPNGYWKSNGVTKTVYSDDRAIGTKKAFSHYQTRMPPAGRTGWFMHEYRLLESECDNPALAESYALCRVSQKSLMRPDNVEGKSAEAGEEEEWRSFIDDDPRPIPSLTAGEASGHRDSLFFDMGEEFAEPYLRKQRGQS